MESSTSKSTIIVHLKTRHSSRSFYDISQSLNEVTLKSSKRKWVMEKIQKHRKLWHENDSPPIIAETLAEAEQELLMT